MKCEILFWCVLAAARVYALPKEDFALMLGSIDQLKILYGLTWFINHILQRQPLMQKARADVSSSSPAALQQRLPTPPPAVWRQIETIVLRALVLLDWVLTNTGSNPSVQCELDQQSEHDKLETALLVELERLFQTLLLPHLLDMQLDMGRVYKEGLRAVLISQCFLKDGFGSLATAMLRRLAQDTRLVKKHGAADNFTTYALHEDSRVCENIYLLLGQLCSMHCRTTHACPLLVLHLVLQLPTPFRVSECCAELAAISCVCCLV